MYPLNLPAFLRSNVVDQIWPEAGNDTVLIGENLRGILVGANSDHTCFVSEKYSGKTENAKKNSEDSKYQVSLHLLDHLPFFPGSGLAIQH